MVGYMSFPLWNCVGRLGIQLGGMTVPAGFPQGRSSTGVVPFWTVKSTNLSFFVFKSLWSYHHAVLI